MVVCFLYAWRRLSLSCNNTVVYGVTVIFYFTYCIILFVSLPVFSCNCVACDNNSVQINQFFYPLQQNQCSIGENKKILIEIGFLEEMRTTFGNKVVSKPSSIIRLLYKNRFSLFECAPLATLRFKIS